MYNKSTYTFGMIKQNVYKALEEFSVNGYGVSVTKGVAADIEKRFLAALNMCARRVALSFPLLIKRVEIAFVSYGSVCKAVLPDDFAKVYRLKISGIGEISDKRYAVSGNILTCTAAKDGSQAFLEYAVKLNSFTPETEDSEPVNLPDISSDALIYLTAAELCPTDCSELYSRLMFKYQDIALNCYNAESGTHSARNRFFGKSCRKAYGRR